jgi:hypothetical protein
MTTHERAVINFLTSIKNREMTVEGLREVIARARLNRRPCRTTLGTIAAAEEALRRIEAAVRRRDGGQ